jgi:hypothetical protein
LRFLLALEVRILHPNKTRKTLQKIKEAKKKRSKKAKKQKSNRSMLLLFSSSSFRRCFFGAGMSTVSFCEAVEFNR